MKRELSDQSRAIIAAGLSLLAIIGYRVFYNPPEPPPAAVTQTTPGAANNSVQSGAGAASQTVAAAPTGTPAVAAVADNAEKTFVVENSLYRVVLSNRGAAVHSWQLKNFTDEGTPPRTLDVVNADMAQKTGGWPLSLQMGDSQLEAAANQGLYTETSSTTPTSSSGNAAGPATGTISAPAEIEFHWSDGHLDVTKHLKFGSGYIVTVQTTVQLDGKAIPHGISWRGGFGDATMVSRRGTTPVQVFFGQDDKIDTLVAAKLGQPKQPSARFTQPGPYEFVGIEDMYFTAAFLPPVTAGGQLGAPNLTLTDWAPEIDTTQPDGKIQKNFVAEMAAGSAASGPLDLRMYIGPKGIDGLKAVRPPLNGLVQFGWFTVIAEPLFYALRWVHKYVPNYGWAIVVLTIALNIALFPLKAMSMRAAQKMQRVAPEIRSIQDRYKKYSARDPRKQEMNKEVMAVYSREGINPFGSCLPMLAQMPIWFGLYRMLEYTIELRHAPWIGWIHDLSAPDPYYILPILLALTGYLQTKMTPTPGVDPAQARMMSLMPLAFGFFFIFYPSGLSLYILGSYAIGIAQQYYLNRTSPLKAPARARKK